MRKTSFMVILEYVFFLAAVEMNACVRARECVRLLFFAANDYQHGRDKRTHTRALASMYACVFEFSF